MSDRTATPSPFLELVRHPLRMRMLTVQEVSRPTPRLVRVALGGADLDGFSSDGPADHVKVFFPRRGETEPVVPRLGPDGIVPGDGPPPIARDYTPRHHRLAEGVLELDLVLHDGGHAAAWAEGATVGDRLGVAGPRGSHVPTGAIAGLLLVADQTGLPAVQNWLRWAPAGMPVTSVVAVADDTDVQPLDTDADLDARWVHHRPVSDGDGAALLAALADVEPRPAGTLHWIAAETAAVQAVRRFLIDTRGVDRAAVDSRGYWKRGKPGHEEPHAD